MIASNIKGMPAIGVQPGSPPYVTKTLATFDTAGLQSRWKYTQATINMFSD